MMGSSSEWPMAPSLESRIDKNIEEEISGVFKEFRDSLTSTISKVNNIDNTVNNIDEQLNNKEKIRKQITNKFDRATTDLTSVLDEMVIPNWSLSDLVWYAEFIDNNKPKADNLTASFISDTTQTFDPIDDVYNKIGKGPFRIKRVNNTNNEVDCIHMNGSEIINFTLHKNQIPPANSADQDKSELDITKNDWAYFERQIDSNNSTSPTHTYQINKIESMRDYTKTKDQITTSMINNFVANVYGVFTRLKDTDLVEKSAEFGYKAKQGRDAKMSDMIPYAVINQKILTPGNGVLGTPIKFKVTAINETNGSIKIQGRERSMVTLGPKAIGPRVEIDRFTASKIVDGARSTYQNGNWHDPDKLLDKEAAINQDKDLYETTYRTPVLNNEIDSSSDVRIEFRKP